MTTIRQRPKECTLAAICNLNGLSQEAYEAISDKVHKKHGPHADGGRFKKRCLRLAYGITLCRKLGLQVPDDYIVSNMRLFPAGRAPELGGSGILHVSFFKRKARKPITSHAIAFRDGTVLDDGITYASWEAYVARSRASGLVHRVRIDRIFRKD